MKLYLQNIYSANGVQVEVAKDSLLTLDKEDRKCQEESEDNCNTMKYMDALKERCQCLPFQLRFLGDKVESQKKLLNLHCIVGC